LVCIVDGVRLRYIRVIVIERLGRERRVAIWFRLLYGLIRAGIFMWNRGRMRERGGGRVEGRILVG